MSESKAIPVQSGIIPFRRTDHGAEVLLVTSMTRGRWIIPKGNVGSGMSRRESAIREAYEEAGIRGTVRPLPVGTYVHQRPDGTSRVEVYLMEVQSVLDSYPESEVRERRWFRLPQAIQEVEEEGLRTIFLELIEILY
jgi:8-oxo-dGTP pyrophosphatase MutT (NUDIX family)